MRVNTPNIIENAEFVVLAPSGGFKLRYQDVPNDIEVPDDTEVIIGRLFGVSILGWSAALPIWCSYDAEKLHKWPLDPPIVSEPEPVPEVNEPEPEPEPEVKEPEQEPESELGDEFTDSLLTPPKELVRSPFPSLEIKRGHGPLPEKRY